MTDQKPDFNACPSCGRPVDHAGRPQDPNDPNDPYFGGAPLSAVHECADVANFAMMVADYCGALPALDQRTTPPRDDVREKVARKLLELEVFGVFHGHEHTTAETMKEALFVADAILAIVQPEAKSVYLTAEQIGQPAATDDGPGDAWELWREVTNHTETKTERVKDDVTDDREVAEGWTAMETMPGARHYTVPLYRHLQSDQEPTTDAAPSE